MQIHGQDPPLDADCDLAGGIERKPLDTERSLHTRGQQQPHGGQASKEVAEADVRPQPAPDQTKSWYEHPVVIAALIAGSATIISALITSC